MSTIAHTHTHNPDQPHIGPKTYLIIYVALLGLVMLTVVAALVDMGAANFAVASGIAAGERGLSILSFRHVRARSGGRSGGEAGRCRWLA